MGLAVAILAVRGAVPEGLKLYRFPESDWAVFSARGPLPGSLQTLNTYVWQTWYPAEGQQVVGNGAAALEVYSAGDMQTPDYACGIWVPIVRPQQTADDSARRAAGAFISDGAVGSVAGMPAVRRGLPALQTRDLCRQARLAGINYTCEAVGQSHAYSDHR